jgi:serine/threonine protein kinase
MLLGLRADLASGARLGPYEIVAKIGGGGMGEVYRARDDRLKRDVAIKVLPASVSTDPDRLRRFEKEAQAAPALNHPNIMSVFDIGSHDGTPYIVSELLEGQTLRERLAAMLQRPRDWQYGYELSKHTGLKSGTLYPLLIRLSDQHLLESEWREPERPGRPPRHAYRLTASGLTFAREAGTSPKDARPKKLTEAAI